MKFTHFKTTKLLTALMLMSTGLSAQSIDLKMLENGNHRLALEDIYSYPQTQLKSSNPNEEIYYLDSISREEYDINSSSWKVTGKDILTYDSTKKLNLILSHSWNQNDSIWEEARKEEYNFNSNGIVTHFAFYNWDMDNSQWIGSVKQNISLNTNGKRDSTASYFWDEQNNDWLIRYKYIYKYDDSNFLKQVINNQWDPIGENWFFTYMNLYTHDSAGNIIEDRAHNWNDSSETWEEYGKFQNNYDSQGKRIFRSFSSLADSQYNTWWKQITTYDENGVITGSYHYNRNTTTDSFEIGRLTEYENDSLGNRLEEVYSNNFNHTNEITFVNKIHTTYELSIPSTSLAMHPFSTGLTGIMDNREFNNIPLAISVSIWNEDFEEWEPSINKNLFYSQFETTTSVKQNKAKLSTLYPNPVTDNLSFSFAEGIQDVTFDLYDVQGRLVLSREIEGSNTVNLESVKTGIYFYRLTADGKTQTGKVIKN